MKRKIRKILFLALVATFAVAAPTVLLFTSGYRYSWLKHRIEKTGIIYVDSDPENAVVMVDGNPAKETTPLSIPNLLPEEYRVTVAKPGFLTWAKGLSVDSGRTTFAKGVTLLRDEVPSLVKSADISISDFSDDGTAVAYLAEADGWNEISLFDFRTEDTLLLARFGKDKFEDIRLSLSADGSLLLFDGSPAAETGRTMTLYPADVAGRGSAIAPGVGGTAGLSAAWSLDGHSMVAFGESGAFVVDTDDGTITPLPAGRRIRDAFQADDALWLVREGEETDLLERIRPDGRSASEGVVALPHKGYGFVGGSDRYLVLADGRAGGGLMFDAATGSLRELPDATGLAWEYPDNSGRILLWNDFEIFVMDPARPEITLITRIGTGIGACAWHPESKYVFYSDTEGITAIELDGRDRRNVYRLVDFDSVGAIAVDREAGVLRFTGSVGNQHGVFDRPL